MTKYFPLVYVLLLILLFCFSSAQESFQDWLKNEQDQFQSYIEEEDRQFADFLKKEWIELQAMQGITPDSIPKPKITPLAEPQPAPPVSNPEDIIKLPPKRKVLPIEIPKITPVPSLPTLRFSFLGHILELPYDPKISNWNLAFPLDKNDFSKTWTCLCQAESKSILNELQILQKDLNLNSWGYYQLCQQFSKQLFKNKSQQALLLSWFLLIKSGYDIKIAYNINKLHLLAVVDAALYSTPFLEIKGKRYYIISLEKGVKNVGSLFTYEGQYQNKLSALSIYMPSMPRVAGKSIKKNLLLQNKSQRTDIPITLNNTLIDYLKFLPQMEYKIYFSAEPRDTLVNEILSAFQQILIDKSKEEAVSILLHFCQKAFEYQTDQQQFGFEKPMFAEETLFYPASDCEDRSILFAWLVKELVNLEVIGLDFPGHVATAVHFPDNINGDKIVFQNKSYIICDPTFINANIGQCMPNFKNVNPTIIQWQ